MHNRHLPSPETGTSFVFSPGGEEQKGELCRDRIWILSPRGGELERGGICVSKPRLDSETVIRARKLRQRMTIYERKLWRSLRKNQLCGLRFRRQHPIPPYIVDFYCHSHRLVVELDGAYHGESKVVVHDQVRTAALEAQGYRVLRFTNQQVTGDAEGVLVAIAAVCGLALGG
jgi:very-short-patch-repair endonuclease